MHQKRIFTSDNYYHVFNKSISGYKIFSSDENKQRLFCLLNYYNNTLVQKRFSQIFLKKEKYNESLFKKLKTNIVKYVSYCIMPTHYHLLVKVILEDRLSNYISRINNAYSNYFNKKHNRKGPLWQSRFRSVLVKTDVQLLHLTRYIHLNPTSSTLVEKPEDWLFSSYNEYISNPLLIKEYLTEIPINDPKKYKEFVNNRIDYQRKLYLIRKCIIDK